MCTILTVDTGKYMIDSGQSFIKQILEDSRTNEEGVSVVFLDPETSLNNTIYRTMNVDNAIAVIGMLMGEASNSARLFVHLRAATTSRVGVAFTHAFDDMQGIVWMHNGVLSNPQKYAVDSFQLATMPDTDGPKLLRALRLRKQSFANVFRIDTELYSYVVTRLNASSLYTDGAGNYSTNQIVTLGITTPVDVESYQEHSLPVPIVEVEKKDESRFNYAGYTGTYDSDYWDRLDKLDSLDRMDRMDALGVLEDLPEDSDEFDAYGWRRVRRS